MEVCIYVYLYSQLNIWELLLILHYSSNYNIIPLDPFIFPPNYAALAAGLGLCKGIVSGVYYTVEIPAARASPQSIREFSLRNGGHFVFAPKC